MGRGPQRVVVGAGGRSRRSPRISVVVSGTITLDHIGPASTVHAPTQVFGVVDLNHIGPTSTLLGPQLNGQITLNHIGPTASLFEPTVEEPAPVTDIGRGPHIRFAGSGARTRRGPSFQVNFVPDQISLPLIGPTAVLYPPTLPALIGRGPQMRVSGAAGRVRRGRLHHVSGFDPSNIALPLIASTKVHALNITGATISLGHIGPTSQVFSPTVVTSVAGEAGIPGVVFQLAKGRPFVLGAGFAAGYGFSIAFEAEKTASPLVLPLIGPTSQLFAPTVSGQNLVLPHVGPTSVLHSPLITTTITLPHIGPASTLHSPVVGQTVTLPHIGPVSSLFSPQLTSVGAPSLPDVTPAISAFFRRKRPRPPDGWRRPPSWR